MASSSEGDLLDSVLRFDIVHEEDKSEFKGQLSKIKIPDAWK